MAALRRALSAALLAAAPIALAFPAAAQGQLNLYCSVQIEWCTAIVTNLQRDTGIRVNMTQCGSGETLAAIRAEGQNPRGDIWFGGTGDSYLAAGEENLTQSYESPRNADLRVLPTGARDGLPTTVARATYMGSHTEYHFDTALGTLFALGSDRLAQRAPGEAVLLALNPERVVLVRP